MTDRRSAGVLACRVHQGSNVTGFGFSRIVFESRSVVNVREFEEKLMLMWWLLAAFDAVSENETCHVVEDFGMRRAEWEPMPSG